MHYGTSARMGTECVLDLAEGFFVGRLGLRLVSRGPGAVEFSGSPGTVSVRAQPIAEASEVFLTTQGLDAEVRSFMARIFEDVAPEDAGV